jgi:uncharacterized protein GlcG (DUF336 family)
MRISNDKLSTDVVQLVSVLGLLAGGALLSGCASEAKAQEASPGCAEVPGFSSLQAVLKDVVHGDLNGGAGNEMWGAIVNREGVVCSVAFSGDDRGDQFPGSRTIAAAKANTSNAFSLPGSPLASGNLYKNTQPGGPIFGLESGNPVDTAVAYQGESRMFGTAADPLVGKKIGGTIVFGGGLPLYSAAGKLVGGVGVSGDSSCADHIIAWEMRAQLSGDNLPTGTNDNLTIGVGEYPDCGSGSAALIAALPTSFPLTVVAR